MDIHRKTSLQKPLIFFFPPNMWDKGVGVLFFGLYKELCVCASWDVWIRDSHIFKVWMFGDNVSEHA